MVGSQSHASANNACAHSRVSTRLRLKRAKRALAWPGRKNQTADHAPPPAPFFIRLAPPVNIVKHRLFHIFLISPSSPSSPRPIIDQGRQSTTCPASNCRDWTKLSRAFQRPQTKMCSSVPMELCFQKRPECPSAVRRHKAERSILHCSWLTLKTLPKPRILDACKNSAVSIISCFIHYSSRP
jgi:hypothetical protein